MTGPDRSFNLADLYELVADTCPDRTALITQDRDGQTHRLTYSELDRRGNRVAHALQAGGVSPGEHVAVLAHNRAEWLECMLGCIKSRAAAVNVNYRYLTEELTHVIAGSDAVALVAEQALLETALAARDRLPRLRQVLVLSDDTPGRPTRGTPYEQALAAASAERDVQPRSADDPYLLYTGGTTGLPKGVLWRQEDIFFAAMGGAAGATGEPITRPEEITGRVAAEPLRYQVHAPLMHGGAQWATWQALTTGNTVVLWTRHRFDAAAALRLAERERSQILMIVGNAMAGPLAEEIAAHPDSYDLSSVLALGSGGAALSQRVRERFGSHLPGAQIRDHLGVSETGALGQAVTGTARGTATRFRPGPEFAVLDENLLPIPAGSGQTGMLARRGHIPLAYYNDAERTATTFVTDGGGVRWALQGDYATVEDDGAITFLGRGSQVVDTGGEKVYTEEVEAALRAHPAVDDATVVGVPDDRLGSRVTAAVVICSPTTSSALSEHCRARLAAYKIPRTIVFVDALPRTEAGKPDYPAVVELAAAGGGDRCPPPRPPQLDSPLLPRILKLMSSTQTWLYRRTGGRVGGKWRIGAGFRKPVPVLLLDHRGRRSGRLFTTPLLYVRHGADVVVVASQGGLPSDPQWYRNLLARPDTHVQIGATRHPVRARRSGPDERERLWPLLVEAYADFDTYQAWTERDIPVVVLEPRPAY